MINSCGWNLYCCRGVTGPTGSAGSSGRMTANYDPMFAGQYEQGQLVVYNGALYVADSSNPRGIPGTTGSDYTALTPEYRIERDVTGSIVYPFNPDEAPYIVQGELVVYEGRLYQAQTSAPTGVPGSSDDFLLLGGGATGPAGMPGPTGATGSQGLPGQQGSAGETGSSGQQGATGATGPSGQQGATGATGLAGSTGATGAQGSAGTQGATGPTGLPGQRGEQGATGATGIQGPAGPQGIAGATGPAGSGNDEEIANLRAALEQNSELIRQLLVSVNFDYDEKPTGSYYNGKPVFRRAFHFDITQNANQQDDRALIPETGYVDSIVNSGGYWATGNGPEKFAINGTYVAPNALYGFAYVNTQNQLYFRSNSSLARNEAPTFVWVDYTKV